MVFVNLRDCQHSALDGCSGRKAKMGNSWQSWSVRIAFIRPQSASKRDSRAWVSLVGEHGGLSPRSAANHLVVAGSVGLLLAQCQEGGGRSPAVQVGCCEFRNLESFAPTVHGRSGVIASGRPPLAHGQLYLSISEAQFKVIDKGAALASSSFVAIKNFCPSPLIS